MNGDWNQHAEDDMEREEARRERRDLADWIVLAAAEHPGLHTGLAVAMGADEYDELMDAAEASAEEAASLVRFMADEDAS